MKIGIVSDSHGNKQTVAAALKLLSERGVGCILHCGDIDDAATVHLFAGTPTHFVLGNCDHDEAALREAARQIGATLHGRFAALELDGIRIAMIHGDDEKRKRAEIDSGEHDYLFCGHTHVAERQRVGPTLVVNPGALHRARPKTCVVLDLQTRGLELLHVAD